jgi:alpha-L-rhamnosidase
MGMKRREAIKVGVAGLVTAALAPSAKSAVTSRSGRPDMLRVCGLDRPLALGGRVPHFSWCHLGSQQAYRIKAARSREAMHSGGTLLWDSGWVEEDRCFDAAYGGPALPARAQVFWQVECRVSGLETPVVSPVASFETGLIEPADWQAQWIASETATARLDREAGLHWIAGSTLPKVDQVRHYRWMFEAAEAGPAELLLSTNKQTGIWHNAQPIVADQDDPVSWTTMAVYPVQLVAGRNVFAVSSRRVVGFGSPPPMLAAQLRHGPQLNGRATSQQGWKTSLSESESWQSPAFDDSGWELAVKAGGAPKDEPWPTYPAMLLRCSFNLSSVVRRARLYATACGAYEATINGMRVGNARMAPEFTDTRRRLLYQAHDVTELLKYGSNVLGFEVADGWYGSEYAAQGRYALGQAPNRLLAQLEIELANGRSIKVSSDDSWKSSPSSILASEIYDGEVQDARLVQPDWSRPGFDDAKWALAALAPAPPAAIEPQQCAPIRVTKTLQPVARKKLTNGNWVLDFGQNFSGWVRLNVAGAPGDRIVIRFAELLSADGGLDQSNLRTAAARDIYILSGKGRETFEPRFTYHGFRYAQIEGLTRADWSAEACVVHQDLPVTGQFRVGDPVIQKFWENSVWSQRSNFFGLPTDCPQRDERLGWMGDAQVFWEAAAFNMDVQAFTSRLMEDVRHGQGAKGGFPDCIPPYSLGLELSSPGWADAGIILPHAAWRQYGDTEIVSRNWPAMERYLDWIAHNNPDHIWRKSRGADYGDWLAVDAKNPSDATTPKDLIGTAFWAHDAALMADMAQAVGKLEEANRYRALLETLKAAFNAAFVKADGTVGNGSQTSYILAIRFGLLPEPLRLEAGKRLAADIARRGGKLSTGFLGTPYILDALAETGQERTAIDLLLQRGFPSWGYMVTQGATTMWERWNSDQGDAGMNSRNHYAFGAIGGFLFRRIAGIEAAEPGFRRVRIAPIVDPRLKSGGATYRSIAGTITTDWRVRGPAAELTIELPSNVRGELVVPGQPVCTLAGGRQHVLVPLRPA